MRDHLIGGIDDCYFREFLMSAPQSSLTDFLAYMKRVDKSVFVTGKSQDEKQQLSNSESGEKRNASPEL